MSKKYVLTETTKQWLGITLYQIKAITIKLQPDENRDIALASIDTKVALAPTKGVATKFVIDRDGRGSVVGAELVSGNKNQMMVDNDGDLADDRGRKVADEGGKVVNFK